MIRKKKHCKGCKEDKYLHSKGLCLDCDKKINSEKYKIRVTTTTSRVKFTQTDKTSQKSIKYTYKPTGELNVFYEIYEERGRKCQLTQKYLEFSPSCFAHILSKGAYPSLRLVKDNIIMIQERAHHLYDNSGKEELLKEYPSAVIIYELKDILRQRYYHRI